MSREPVDLNPDGPHGPERTAEAGQLLDDVSRFITYATMPEKGGLKDPADVYRLLADFYAATARGPQVCEQIQRFLLAQAATGRLYEARGRDIAGQVEQAAVDLDAAARSFDALTRAMQAAQSDIVWLGVREDSDD